MFTKIYFVTFVLTLCVHSYFAVTLGDGEAPQLTEYKNEITENGYFFKYSTNDGQLREETGELVKKGDETILRVSGYYTYIGSDGQEYFTEYESGENGYKAKTRIMEPSIGLPGAVLASLAGGGLG